ncbi:MAG TPA: NAD(P)-dependent oxidoreductase [Candidatus Bathyarchaeia archaeon]|nr:NAD(P)-dependent oxidoreductase [Candidatus Bathyarchaeia archaeon]
MTILVVGGLNGFVGSNTTEALVNLGQDCVVTRHKRPEIPRFLQSRIDHKRVIIEDADATSIDDLRRIGEKHRIDGIVNVGGGFKVPKSPYPGLKGYFDMLDAMFQLAQEWKVKRVTFSSTGGMYLGLQGTASEDQPIYLQSPLPGIPGILQRQKIVEVASEEFTKATGISSICCRLMGFYGPFQDVDQASVANRLVHAAVRGKPLDLEGAFFSFTDDAVDVLYIKDLARAVALLHTAEKLNYNVYNIGTGKATPNREFLESTKKAVPGFDATLPPGKFPFPAILIMNTKRLQADTGFTPKFDTQSAIQDYVDWLKAGNPK